MSASESKRDVYGESWHGYVMRVRQRDDAAWGDVRAAAAPPRDRKVRKKERILDPQAELDTHTHTVAHTQA